MSFILDALRKSEHERQRSSVPSLTHVPLAAPRREMPRWAVIVIGALGAAVLLLGGAWWQSMRAPLDGRDAPAARVERPLELPAPGPTLSAPQTSAAPAATRVERPQPAVSRSLSQAVEPEPPPATAFPGATAPATPPAAAASAPDRGEPTLPSAASLAAQGIALPTLRLELHAYAERPSDRFVFINGRKYAEGDRLVDGPELLAIAPNGAVLRHLGQRFLLTPE